MCVSNKVATLVVGDIAQTYPLLATRTTLRAPLACLHPLRCTCTCPYSRDHIRLETRCHHKRSTPAVAYALFTMSMTSKPWTPEETREGADIVRAHLWGARSHQYAIFINLFLSERRGSRAPRPHPQASAHHLPHVSLILPDLPHLSPMSQALRTGSVAGEGRGGCARWSGARALGAVGIGGNIGRI